MKQKTNENTSIFDIIRNVDNSAEILADTAAYDIEDYINTGNYILNAAMTGSIFKGVPSGRVLCLAGAKGTGKSYLSLSICREAQKKGYFVIYMDSEGAIDREFVTRLGCNLSLITIKQVSTIPEVSTYMANILKQINEQPKDKRQKVIFVLDSLGNLSSTKELNDTLDGVNKQDMTRAKEIKSLFRTNATALNKAQAPFIVTSHTYMTQDLFAKTIISGGTGIEYNASLTLIMSTSKYEDKDSEKIVSGKVGDYTKLGVTVTAKPEKSRFTIPQKVQFYIPYFKAPNPYIGLEKYLTWENSGIIEGVLLTKKEYNKLSDSDKETIKTFEKDGEIFYAFPKIAGINKNRTIVVSHLGAQLPLSELFTSRVLTDDILHKIDEEVIRPEFELPSQDSFDDLSEFVNTETGEMLK